jgi:hypothetical protein
MKRKGICFVCGCTQEEGCNEGCDWANVKRTLCTACAPLTEQQRKQKRAESLNELVTRHELAELELSSLALRIEAIWPLKATQKKRRAKCK